MHGKVCKVLLEYAWHHYVHTYDGTSFFVFHADFRSSRAVDSLGGDEVLLEVQTIYCSNKKRKESTAWLS